MTDTEFDAILNEQKYVHGDISWTTDEDHSFNVEFRQPVIFNGAGLYVRGSYNPLASKLSYLLLYHGIGRIYALDIGADHHNPDCQNVGRLHKHTWRAASREKFAYVPTDITEPTSNPLGVWQQFCKEANLIHVGQMEAPPAPLGVLI